MCHMDEGGGDNVEAVRATGVSPSCVATEVEEAYCAELAANAAAAEEDACSEASNGSRRSSQQNQEQLAVCDNRKRALPNSRKNFPISSD